jgi:HSP20 family protein
VAERPGAFQPNVDIYETGEEWVIVADVPGATKEGLDLSFDDGILSVAAKVAPRKAGETGFKLREYPIGDFERRFRVGEGVDAGRINAALESGVLTIRLPKAESAKPRKIEIRSN